MSLLAFRSASSRKAGRTVSSSAAANGSNILVLEDLNRTGHGARNESDTRELVTPRILWEPALDAINEIEDVHGVALSVVRSLMAATRHAMAEVSSGPWTQ